MLRNDYCARRWRFFKMAMVSQNRKLRGDKIKKMFKRLLGIVDGNTAEYKT
jgi:hypothetical protein